MGRGGGGRNGRKRGGVEFPGTVNLFVRWLSLWYDIKMNITQHYASPARSSSSLPSNSNS